MNPTSKPLLLLLGLLLLATTTLSRAIHTVPVPKLGSGATAVACVPRERDALLAFKRGITSDPLGLLTSWKEDDHDCCRWRGVTCSNLTGHVLRLHLSGIYTNEHTGMEGLVGQISPQLLYLDHLEHLDLSINYLEGQVVKSPSSWAL